MLTALGAGKVLLGCRAATCAGACEARWGWEDGAAGGAGGALAFSGWPVASPKAARLLPGAGGAKDISPRVGFGSLGCAV